MKISALNFNNVRCFEEQCNLELSNKINIFIGPNNSGKSTILNLINLLQTKAAPESTLGGPGASINYTLAYPINLSLAPIDDDAYPIFTKSITLSVNIEKKTM